MLIASSLFLFKTVNAALPYNQLAKIIGGKAAAEVKLEELHTGDSFNDGEWAYGIISCNESTIKLITESKVMEHEISIANHFYIFKNHKLPETGDLYSDNHGYFYVSPGDSKIYFCWHSSINIKKAN